ncbi:MAG TPA: hypothetical protein VGI50_03675 [Solirubrobacteraceae bacterium]
MLVDKKDDPQSGKVGIILGPFDNGYPVQIPGAGVFTFSFLDLKLAQSGATVPGLLEADVPGPYHGDSSVSAENKEAARQAPWSALEAQSLADLAQSIVTRYPPESYAYIPIGNSPALVMEFIRQDLSDRGSAATILAVPISGVSAESYVENRATPERQENLKRYFSQYLPRELFQTKRPLVLDYSSGQSLRIMAIHIGRYLERQVEVLNLRSGPPIEPLQNLGELEALGDEQFTKNEAAFKEEAKALGSLTSADPDTKAEAFLHGIAVKEEGQLRWKEGFGYKLWKDTPYDAVLTGKLAKGEADESANARVVKAVSFIRSALAKGALDWSLLR